MMILTSDSSASGGRAKHMPATSSSQSWSRIRTEATRLAARVPEQVGFLPIEDDLRKLAACIGWEFSIRRPAD